MQESFPDAFDWGKFLPLKDYFAALTLDDLAHIADYEIIQAAKPKHRLLMTSFVHNVLRPVQHNRESDAIHRRLAQDPVADVCALQERLCSTVFKKKHLVPCDEVQQFVREKYSQERRQAMRVLDVTQNGLQANDLPHIAALVSAELPRCSLVLLSNNNLTFGNEIQLAGAVEAIKMLLNHADDIRVDVAQTSMATADYRSMFESLSPAELLRLIWVSEDSVPGYNWHSMLKKHPEVSAELLEKIAQQHAEYYRINLPRPDIKQLSTLGLFVLCCSFPYCAVEKHDRCTLAYLDLRMGNYRTVEVPAVFYSAYARDSFLLCLPRMRLLA